MLNNVWDILAKYKNLMLENKIFLSGNLWLRPLLVKSSSSVPVISKVRKFVISYYKKL